MRSPGEAYLAAGQKRRSHSDNQLAHESPSNDPLKADGAYIGFEFVSHAVEADTGVEPWKNDSPTLVRHEARIPSMIVGSGSVI